MKARKESRFRVFVNTLPPGLGAAPRTAVAAEEPGPQPFGAALCAEFVGSG